MSESFDVHYWTMENIYSEGIDLHTEEDGIAVGVNAEVPMSETDQRLPRHGRRYWPTLVELEYRAEKLSLFVIEARALASALLHAAASAELIDAPDVDRCGHWAPCECSRAAEGSPQPVRQA